MTDGELAQWWLRFEDRHLSILMQKALVHNRDIQIAEARLREARATTRTAAAALLPSANASIGFTNSQRSNNSPAIPRFEAPAGAADLIPRRYSLFDAAFDSSYEFDLYGTNRKSYAASKADQQAQLEDSKSTRLSLTAEVARDYFDLREAQSRIDIARENIKAIEQTLEILHLREEAGLQNGQEAVRLEGQLASARAGLPSLESMREQAILALSTLTGGQPDTVRLELGENFASTQLPEEVPGGLPSELLLRRPDIRKAIAELDSATARRQSAETDWFPKIKLTANRGGQSGDFANLLSTDSLISTFAPKLSWGIFNYRQTKSNIEQKLAREALQLASLEKTILAAFEDVEKALSNYYRERERLKHLEIISSKQRESTHLARKRHDAGLDTIIPVIERERDELNATEQKIQARANVQRNLVALLKALGGGW